MKNIFSFQCLIYFLSFVSVFNLESFKNRLFAIWVLLLHPGRRRCVKASNQVPTHLTICVFIQQVVYILCFLDSLGSVYWMFTNDPDEDQMKVVFLFFFTTEAAGVLTSP